MSKEQTSADSVKKPKRGRQKKGVSADNIHEIVSSLSKNNFAYLEKEEYHYQIHSRNNLKELLNELFNKGYRDYKSPAHVNKAVQALLRTLTEDNLTDDVKEKIEAEINKKKAVEYIAEEADIEKLQKAIDAMGPEFWKRIQTKIRQAKHKAKSPKQQISVDADILYKLAYQKDELTWNEFLSNLEKMHQVMGFLMKDTHSSNLAQLINKLEESGAIEEDFQKRHFFFF
ncbi:MAG: hypothetical protein ACPGR2_01920 [Psychrobium sp.]